MVTICGDTYDGKLVREAGWGGGGGGVRKNVAMNMLIKTEVGNTR